MDFGAILRQWPLPQSGAEDDERERLLDAARAEFVAHGIRRAAVADIARRAKVSRQTLNRKCGDKDEMVAAVVTREVFEFFLRLGQSFESDVPVEDQVVELFVAGVRECQQNPMVTAIREYEPERMSFSLLEAEHDNYQMVISALALRLMAESFSAEGARQAAELITRITVTLLLAPSKALRTETDEQSREFARTYFVPILNAARAIA
ncbi:TetR/AcrR family transcriptional regulator [Mycobacterium sp. HM-7]